MTTPVLIATDLTEASDPAIARGAAHAQAVSAQVVICHVIPDVFRTHPLQPTGGDNAIALSAELTKRAADLATEQARRVAGLSPDQDTVVIETGSPGDEIVRVAEERRASLVVIGGKPEGRTAERVVRYASTPVLVARRGPTSGKILVATDFSTAALPALVFAKTLIENAHVEATLLHVMQPPQPLLPSIASAFGSPIVPAPPGVVERLEELGKETLDGLAKSYGIGRTEQVEGDPATTIVEQARAIGAEMIVMGSRGRTGLARLVLGSTAEHVIRTAPCSVLVAR